MVRALSFHPPSLQGSLDLDVGVREADPRPSAAAVLPAELAVHGQELLHEDFERQVQATGYQVPREVLCGVLVPRPVGAKEAGFL